MFFLTDARPSAGEADFAPATATTILGRHQKEMKRRENAANRQSEIFRAAEEAQVLTQNATNLVQRRKRAYDDRIKAVKDATGIELENPYRVRTMPTMDELKARLPNENIHETRKRLFAERLADLQRQHPDKADRIQAGYSLEDQARQIGQDAETRLSTLMADPNNPRGSLGASFGGSAWGYVKDPLQFITLFAGGGSGTGATVGGRILSAFVREGLVNAGVETVLQVPAQIGRSEAGLESGIAEGARNVGLAGLLGGIAGGTLRGGGEILSALKPGTKAGQALERAATGDVQDADLKTVADALGIDPDPEVRKTFDAALEAAADDRAAFNPAPEGVTREEATRIAREAVEQAADDGPPSSGAVQKPKRPADLASVIDEVADPPTGRKLTVQGKTVRFEQFDPADLKTDAAAYQYKGGGDAAGVTGRLGDVRKWDPTASGKTFVHERADGARYIADGHQRLGLARRLQSEGQDVALDGYLFREKEGWTAAEVRALAAKKNMQEGSGTPLDAARILRDSPELLDDSLPVSGPMMRKAIGLSRLSDEAFGMTVNGLVPENQAALVGEMVPDPALHAGVIQDLLKFAPETERQARLLIGESISSGRMVELQNDMFGSFQVERTLMGERVKVLDAAIKALKSDKRLFATLADNAEVIEAAGNRLDTSGNEAKAATADMVGELLDRMARTRGPVSDALSKAARQMAEGKKPAAAARAFVSDVQTMIDEGGLGRLLSPPEPELKPAATIEPGSPEAASMADELAPQEPTVGELEAAGQGSMWDMLPDGVDQDGKPRFTTASDLEAQAARDADLADLVKSCKD